MSNSISRRSLLRNSLLSGGLCGLGDLVGPSFLSSQAYGQGIEKHNNHLFVLHLRGGYSASFSSAGAFINQDFGGMNGNNSMDLGNDLVVHNMFRAFPSWVRQHMATIGIQHGQSAHANARAVSYVTSNDVGAAHVLASGMGGPSANKFVSAGQRAPMNFRGSVGGTSMQRITDMQAALDALGAGGDSPFNPDRSLAAQGLAASMQQSQAAIAGNPESLISLQNGYQAAIDTLGQPAPQFNQAQMMQDYGLTGTAVANNDLSAQLALAELMFMAETNVVLSNHDGWDNHGDPRMSRVFNMMRGDIIPALNVFFRRVYGDPANNIAPQPAFANKNVVTVITGDFVRRPSNSQHGSGIAATVIGPHVKVGSTGVVDSQARLPNQTPNSAAYWAYLATVLKAPEATVNELVSLGGGGTAQGLARHLALANV